MSQLEFDPTGDHEELALARLQVMIARVAIFDELIDYHLDGTCTFDQAIEQYLHDLSDAGFAYDSEPTVLLAAPPEAG